MNPHLYADQFYHWLIHNGVKFDDPHELFNHPAKATIDLNKLKFGVGVLMAHTLAMGDHERGLHVVKEDGCPSCAKRNDPMLPFEWVPADE